MADWNFILLLILGIVIAAGLGIGGSLAANRFREWILRRRAKEFLEGKRENVYMLDGERVNVNTFIFKTPSGEIRRVEIPLHGKNR